MTIIFARPRHDYESYRDLYALIALSGFPLIYADEIHPYSDNVYVVTILNGETENGWRPVHARIILYDFEYHLSTDGYYRKAFVTPPGVSEVWAGDQWYAEQIGARYVPLGSHPDLRPNASSDHSECYDAAYIGYMVNRRQRIAHDLRERGVSLSPSSAWGDERHRVLSNSKTYLSVHQWDNIPTIAPLRMVVAAAYALPVITETVQDAGAFADCILQADYPYYADCVTAWTHGGRQLEDAGARLHEKLCISTPFRKSIENAL